jgi:hypothetical protein
MAKSNDWLPGARTEILAMCRNWFAYTTEERRTAWGVPAAEFEDAGMTACVCCRYENPKGLIFFFPGNRGPRSFCRSHKIPF